MATRRHGHQDYDPVHETIHLFLNDYGCDIDRFTPGEEGE